MRRHDDNSKKRPKGDEVEQMDGPVIEALRQIGDVVPREPVPKTLTGVLGISRIGHELDEKPENGDGSSDET